MTELEKLNLKLEQTKTNMLLKLSLDLSDKPEIMQRISDDFNDLIVAARGIGHCEGLHEAIRIQNENLDKTRTQLN